MPPSGLPQDALEISLSCLLSQFLDFGTVRYLELDSLILTPTKGGLECSSLMMNEGFTYKLSSALFGLESNSQAVRLVSESEAEGSHITMPALKLL
jgi:hypothetical protein